MAKFQPGQSGNPRGRLPRAKEDKYLQSLTREMKLSDWRDIVRRAISDAKRGDAKARQWLSDYGIGKPAQRIEMDHVTPLEIDLDFRELSDEELTRICELIEATVKRPDQPTAGI